MSWHLLKKIMVASALSLFLPLLLWAQAPVSATAWITITDDAGGHDSLTFGTHMTATYCVDTALGENQSPPYPPGFAAVFTSIPGRVNCFSSLGLIKKDLRDFSSATKKDTFDILFQNLDSAARLPNVSITLRWPIVDSLLRRCDSMFLVDRSFGTVISGRIDMMAQSSVILTGMYDDVTPGPNISAPQVKLRIYRYGSHIVDGVTEESRRVPRSFALHQNYPNPFNPTTTLRFDILNQALTDISVFNILGEKVATLVSREMPRGSFTTTWNGLSDQGFASPSGVYFVRMSAHPTGAAGKEEFFSAVRKLVLMK